MNCKYCGSEHIVNHGFKVTRKERRQRFTCRDCKKRFSEYFDNQKVSKVYERIVDVRGRYISPQEFKWIMFEYFKDFYDHKRIALGIAYTTGLRIEDAIMAEWTWFDNEFRWMKMQQNKAYVKKKDGVEWVTSMPKEVPLPDWLSENLRNYVNYRLRLTKYMGHDLKSCRLFPRLHLHNIVNMFIKMRIRHCDKQPWLKDVWKEFLYYDQNNNLVKKFTLYRVASHAGRANYVTAAYDVCDRDEIATSMLSGHRDTKQIKTYVRTLNIIEKKIEVKERYMDSLASKQSTPVLIGQKRIEEFCT